MPINRFGSTLVSKNIFNDYMNLLKNSYCEEAKENVMCKNMISIDPMDMYMIVISIRC